MAYLSKQQLHYTMVLHLICLIFTFWIIVSFLDADVVLHSNTVFTVGAMVSMTAGQPLQDACRSDKALIIPVSIWSVAGTC